MNKYLCVACVILGIACASLIGWNTNLQDEKARLSDNQTALMEDVVKYQTEAGKNAASVQKLELSKKELEAYNSELSKTITDLRIKLKRVEEASATATKTEVEIQTIVKDTIIYRDTSFMKIQAIKWKDPWVAIAGNLLPEKKLDLKIESVDTLYQVVHRVPHKWWFFKWGTKAIRQDIVSSNPHTHIIYTEYVELKGCKKRKK